jgi:hypothetical protein
VRENVDLESYVYRWDYVSCNNESIDDGDSASGGGIPSNDPPDSNVPSDPIDSNPIDTNPEENQGSNGGSSDGTATIGATDSNCPQSSVPSLGDGRCGSLSEPVKPTHEEVLTIQLNDLIDGTEDSWQFNDSIDETNSFVFSNAQEFNNWKNNNQISRNESLLPTRALDGRWECTAIYTDLLTSVELDFLMTPDDPLTDRINERVIDMESLTAELDGLRIGLEFNNLDAERADVNSLPNVAVIYIPSSFDYNLFIDGIGTLWTDKVQFVVMVDTVTGIINNIYYEDR